MGTLLYVQVLHKSLLVNSAESRASNTTRTDKGKLHVDREIAFNNFQGDDSRQTVALSALSKLLGNHQFMEFG